MKCLRPLGLFLVTTASLVFSLPTDTTTSRYNEGVSRFLNTFSNSSQIFNTENSLITSHLTDITITEKYNLNINENKTKFSGESRKLSSISVKNKKHSQKNMTNNSIETVKNTIKYETVVQNVLSPKPSKAQNSSLILNSVNKVQLQTPTKEPFKISLKGIFTTSRSLTKPATTMRTITFKLTKRTTTHKPPTEKSRTVTPSTKNKTKPKTTKSPTTKPKPTIKRIVTKWSDNPIMLSEIKQNWYEPGVPYPNPSPEIISNSPPFAITDVPPIIRPAQGIESAESNLVDSTLVSSTPVPNSSSEPNLNPISTFNLDMVPDTRDPNGNSPCPTVHISSNMLGPQQRQDCSDLSLVINSHFHQNTGPTRTPGVSSYTGESGVVEGIAEEEIPIEETALADPGGGVGNAPIAADPGVGGGTPLSGGGLPGGGTGGSGGSGGNGGNGGNGSNSGNGLGFPDLKNMFEAIEWICNKLGKLFGFLMNPYLYIIPIALSFFLGFIGKLALFPWWIPLVLFFFAAKSNHQEDAPKITHYKHLHKPNVIHHADGWFWNHETKTWQNVADYIKHRKNDEIKRKISKEEEDLTTRINRIIYKFNNGTNMVPNRKHRRKVR